MKLKPSRKLQWLSSVDPKNNRILSSLQEAMQEFYTNTTSYYEDIDFTGTAWKTDPSYQDMLERIRQRSRIVEVGCGSANLLRFYPDFIPYYSGCDFGEERMQRNRALYSGAEFRPIIHPCKIPFPSGYADAVFSLWVIEHTVFPADFLLECARILKPGGVFILRCPDFLGSSQLSSQRAGFGYGTGRDKLKQGKVWDALITGLDRKIFIPRTCRQLRQKIGDGYGFYINIAPVCFVDPFGVDHDAVYLTYAPEI